MGLSLFVVFARFFLGNVLFRCLKWCHLQCVKSARSGFYENYIGFWCMKSFERLLRGASSGHVSARFLSLKDKMFAENNVFKKTANPWNDFLKVMYPN